MLTGWRYRLTSATGTACFVVGAVLVANHSISQSAFTTIVPLFDRLDPAVLGGSSLRWALVLSVLAIAGAAWPLYKPRPRRILDTVFLVQKRVLVGGLVLATFGYFKWSHRLPRATLVMAVGLLAISLPAWFLLIRARPTDSDGRTLIVGDDLAQIERVAPAVDAPVIGYLCPTVTQPSAMPVAEGASEEAIADGGIELRHDDSEFTGGSKQSDVLDAMARLGGLSRLEDVLVAYDIDTVVLAFRQADRAEFFGALDACHEHGVDAKVHRKYADSVLVSEGDVGELVDVDLEPWDPLDHLFKRIFDVVFAGVGLIALSPLLFAISAAIKLDDGGSFLYRQERTAVFGESFPVYKFRSMIENAESETGATISEEDAGGVDPRVTRVGRMLRRTHLDEIPQLWSILAGDMSVVGPRPERPVLDSEIQSDGIDWEKRWFVKPGLTGLAQINDVTGHEPAKKLRYDLEYVRRQSFWFDVKIVIRQIWKVLSDVREFASDE
ncbi:sugar transferase [Natrinema salifodinae]|uniref:Sugar transferase involved in LPS biosynthesis (Colanic, teichoic acid) n=1 Tax=Natrinema salifodinae TaxID=1202768 RepID=A0A1I0M0G1_9EURY|nr:sugar transferase [Natrinema salifodinae]SEV81769.1 Sugar transferase involved in LPS biosynthesis (colanic, teichoic acid) [Natrinema salifodinae]